MAELEVLELGTEPCSLHASSKKYRYPENFNKNDHFQDYLPAREENAELPPHEGAKIAICPGKEPKALDPSQLAALRKSIW